MKNSTAVPSGAAENRSLIDFIGRHFAGWPGRCQAPGWGVHAGRVRPPRRTFLL